MGRNSHFPEGVQPRPRLITTPSPVGIGALQKVLFSELVPMELVMLGSGYARIHRI